VRAEALPTARPLPSEEVRELTGERLGYLDQAGVDQPGVDQPGAGQRVTGRSGSRSHRMALLRICLTGGLGLLLFLARLHGIRLNNMTGLGLISVLPVVSLVGLGLLVVAFVAMLARGRPHPAMLAVILLAVIFCLDGVTAIAEPLPRFATSYQVSGFVHYIAHTGHVAPGAAAYFSWPGFFALVAFAAGASGAHSLLPLLTWWPVVIDTACLLPFMLITRSLGIGWRARWFAAFLFSVGNWVGQDYFSPQSFNYLLYLSFVAILLTWFSGQPTARRSVANGSSGSAESAASGAAESVGQPVTNQVGGAQRAILLLVLIGIFVTSTVSHQLTPFLMLATCVGLVIVRRCTLRGLPVLLGVILIGWISFGTVAYWSGHLSTIFGHIGQISGNLSSSVGNRLVGTPVHQLVLYSRVGLPIAMAGLAVLGLLRRWRVRADNRALLVLLCVPVTAAALQNYGGEISLRIYLFALPAAAVLAACLFFPESKAGDRAHDSLAAARAASGGHADSLVPAGDAGGDRADSVVPTTRVSEVSRDPLVREAGADQRRHRARPVVQTVAAGLVAVSLAVLFLVARYGNDAFEQVPPGELAAMNYIYAHDHGGISLLWLSQPANVNATPEMPWQYRDITSVQFVAKQASRNPSDVAGVVTALRKLGRGSYLITTATEAAYLRQTGSYPADWATRFRAAMAAAPGIRVVFSNRTAAVYATRLPRGAPRARAAVSVGSAVSDSTAWTPVGLAVLALALLVLAMRAFIAECAPARRQLLRPLTLVSLPLLVLLILVVAERFVMLS